MNSKFFLLALLLIPLVAAIFPGIPHQFYGGVIVEGINPSTGTITAKIDDAVVASTPVTSGRYGWNPIFFIEDPDYTFNGEEIRFYFNGEEAGNYIFENGESTRLDLIVGNYTGFCGDSILGDNEDCDDGSLNGVRCDNSHSDCNYCSSSCLLIHLEEDEDHDNGGNGGRIRELSFLCEPDWDCSNWGECVDGVARRNCEDKNDCGVNYGKPIESKMCELNAMIELEKGAEAGFPWLWLIIALIVIVALFIIVNWVF